MVVPVELFLKRGSKMNKQQSGFTLIELIMVIVILGILSAFALPRFADLSGSAETATIQAALGAVKSASAIAHASALANNQNGATGSVSMEGTAIALAYGYPTAASVCLAANLGATDYTCSGGIITTVGGEESDPCFNYTAAAAVNTAPAISTVGAMNAAGDTCTP